MLFHRRWTTGDVYQGIEFVSREVTLPGVNAPREITVPSGWDAAAVGILATKFMRRAGVPSALETVPEPGVPTWLCRCQPAGLDKVPGGVTFGGETDARQVFRRLAGCWTYWGWRLGYFDRDGADKLSPDDAERNALAFFEECQYMLAAQLFSPASPQWFNCFSGRERLLTREHGPVMLAEVVGEPVTVWTRGGWAAAEVKAFGRQVLRRVTFAPAYRFGESGWNVGRSNARVVVEVTRDHRWLLVGGGETTDLAVGAVVPASSVGLESSVAEADYRSGFRHGVVFGDGSVAYRYKTGSAVRYRVRLCGPKADLAWAFDRVSRPPCFGGDPLVQAVATVDLKDYPDPAAVTPEYLRGFFDGWVATDGSDKGEQTVRLSSARSDAPAWVVVNAAAGGWLVTGHSFEEPKAVQFGDKTYRQAAPQHSIVMTRADRAWKVVAVEEDVSVETVFCAVVPGVGEFTLASGIVTGNCGLHWAYGIACGDSGQWAAEHLVGLLDNRNVGDAERWPETGDVAPVRQAYTRPQCSACFILGVRDDMLGPQGIFDTFTTEARIFKYGSGAGANFSPLRAAGEPLSGGGVSSGLMSWLKIADAGGGAIKSGGTVRRAAKMVVLDVDHPDIVEFVSWKAEEEWRAATMLVGDRVLRSYLPAVRETARAAATRTASAGGDVLADATSAERAVTAELGARLMDGLDMDIRFPWREVVPAGTAYRAELAGRYDADPVWPADPYTDHFEGPGSVYPHLGGQNANNSVRITNEFLRRVDAGEDWELRRRTDGKPTRTVKARDLWDLIGRAAWTSADPGVQWDTLINDWNPCANDGRINATNPCAEYNFLDDTACNLGSLNLLRFALLGDRGAVVGLDLHAYRHGCRLATVILDITVSMAAYPSESIARGSREYRTLGLGYANLGAFLMRKGLPYDSPAARAWCAALTCLMHLAATEASAGLAGELGTFPAHDRNKEHVTRVVGNHLAYARRLARGAAAAHYTGLSVVPPDQHPTALPAVVRDAVGEMADWAESLVFTHGLRNAQLTLLAPTGTIGFVLGCDTTGIEPDLALVKDKKLVGGGRMRIVNQSIPAAMSALGYSESEAGEIERYVLGHRRFPTDDDWEFGLTRGHLGWLGLTDAELDRIEAKLPAAPSLDNAALRSGITAERWARLTGRPEDECADPEFKPISALALKDSADEGSDYQQLADLERFACGAGTVEGAPHLRPGDYAVFDCANRCGHGSRSISAFAHVDMAAAAQPALSGGISKTINLPAEASPEDFKSVYRYGHDRMVKCMAAYADGQKLSQPLQGSRSGRPAAKARVQPVRFWPAPSESAERLGLFGDGSPPPAGVITVPAAEVNGLHPAAAGVTGDGGWSVPPRRDLPDRREGYTQKFKIGRQSFYLRTGQYPDGRLGEFFVDVAKAGSDLKAIANAFAIAVSLGLQRGVPLEDYVESLVGMRFEPAGPVVGSERVKMARSWIDAIFRILAIDYLGRDELADVQIDPDEIRLPAYPAPGPAAVKQPVAATAGVPGAARTPAGVVSQYTGEFCPACGQQTIKRTGVSCVSCECGFNSGCG